MSGHVTLLHGLLLGFVVLQTGYAIAWEGGGREEEGREGGKEGGWREGGRENGGREGGNKCWRGRGTEVESRYVRESRRKGGSM